MSQKKRALPSPAIFEENRESASTVIPHSEHVLSAAHTADIVRTTSNAAETIIVRDIFIVRFYLVSQIFKAAARDMMIAPAVSTAGSPAIATKSHVRPIFLLRFFSAT
jgi:hypothetical protein